MVRNHFDPKDTFQRRARQSAEARGHVKPVPRVERMRAVEPLFNSQAFVFYWTSMGSITGRWSSWDDFFFFDSCPTEPEIGPW